MKVELSLEKRLQIKQNVDIALVFLFGAAFTFLVFWRSLSFRKSFVLVILFLAAYIIWYLASSKWVEAALKQAREDFEGSLGRIAEIFKSLAESKEALQGKAFDTAIKQNIEMVEDMAEHTNMLALNASVEAARAGESGKGFAIVSSEIRKIVGEAKHTISKIAQSVDNIEEQGQLQQALTKKVFDDVDKLLGELEDISGKTK